MSIKDILAIVATDRDTAVLPAAAALAARFDAHVTGLFVAVIPDVGVGEPALSMQFTAEVLTGLREEAGRTYEAVKKQAARLDKPIDVRRTEALFGAAGDTAALAARHADIAVLSMPTGDASDAQRRLFEGALFGSGGPVLLVPPAWRGGAIGKRVVFGWNASKEAARAMRDAIPLLEAGARVTVTTVDAKPRTFGHGEAPGVDMAAHLSRHGFDVEVKNLDGLGRSDASDALLQEAEASRADLLVLGGYGHSRLAQIVFGGVTRELASKSPAPILFSH